MNKRLFEFVRSICSTLALLLAVVVAQHVQAQTQTRVYVNAASSNTAAPSDFNPGDSWNGAYKYLQDGLVRANQLINQNVPAVEIWVAQGTYKPDQGNGLTPGTQTDSFHLKTNVSILGGFIGPNTKSIDPDTRDPDIYITILSGDLAGDDDPQDPFDSDLIDDNNHHVVTADSSVSLNANGKAHLDGVIVTSGNAVVLTNGLGGGIAVASNGAIYVRNCKIHANTADYGGGISASGSSSVLYLRDCEISGNVVPHNGGAIYFEHGTLVLSNCVVSENQANFGGGIIAIDATYALFANCVFDQNEASLDGGGLLITDEINSSTLLMNCQITRNSSGDFSGGVYIDTYSYTIGNCTIADNSATGSGGGVYERAANANILNSILWGNIAGDNSQVSGTAVTIDHSDVQGIGNSGANDNIDQDPLFANPSAGDYRLTCGSPCINAGGDDNILHDFGDVDDDGNTIEETPLDLDLSLRIAGTDTDGDNVDMGAFEKAVDLCIADVNGSGVVNVDDLLAVINAWGPCPTPPALCPADAAPMPCGGNGVVDVSDLLAVINAWGYNCATFSFTDVGSIDSVEDCMDMCSLAHQPNSDAWDACVSKCVQGLCQAEIIECDE